MTGDIGKKSQALDSEKPSCSSISSVSSVGSGDHPEFDLLSQSSRKSRDSGNREFRLSNDGLNSDEDSIHLTAKNLTRKQKAKLKRKLKQRRNPDTSNQSKDTSESFQAAEPQIGAKRKRADSSFGACSNDASKEELSNTFTSSAQSDFTSLQKNARERDKDRIQKDMPIPIGRRRDRDGPD